VPGDPSEDHGYWTTYAMDRTDGASVLMPEASRALPYAGRPSDGRPSGVT
jgi:carotenoid cleavage dioxygenase